jgi:tripartite-type tricarboxylate transporter receptor subunit TctC
MTERVGTRRLRLVIGFSPGSASDIVARALAPVLSDRLRLAVDVEPWMGSSGTRAAAMVAAQRNAPDVLLVATLGTHAVLPNLQSAIGYDPLRDFRAIALLAQAPMVLGVSPQCPARSVEQLLALARSAPAMLKYGTSAVGGAPHLAAALFELRAKVELEHVPYERTDDLYSDLTAGRIHLSFNNAMSMLERMRRGQASGLAVTAANRIAQAPQLPTMAEAGVPDCIVTNWLGVVAAADTGDARVRELNHALLEALRDDGLRARLFELGVEPAGGTPEAFGAHIAAEIAKWAPVVQTFRH